MTETEAKRWLGNNLDVSRETWARLDSFVRFLRDEAGRQNLVSAATLDHIWVRHIVDSAQLIRLAPAEGDWLDLGSGAGFPGLIVALLSNHNVTLVESRAKRIDYLNRAIAHLGLGGCTKVAGMPVERLETAPYSIISARAFAPLPRLLDLSQRFSTQKTLWLLPKGRNAANELEEARKTWNVDFIVENSVTDDDAGILVGRVMGRKAQAPTKGRRKR
jgi:16S rRNA (guanine527-N7)-methyltransferase